MSGGTPPDIAGDLEFLNHHWGEAYEIGAEGGGFTAARRDRKGGQLVAASRDELADPIYADYIADPVPRDLP